MRKILYSISLLIITTSILAYFFYIHPLYQFKNRILSTTDGVNISLFQGEENDPIIKEFRKEDISKFLDFISYFPQKEYKCFYTGEIQFTDDNVVSEDNTVSFQINNPSCRHIIFLHNEKVYSKKITEQGLKFLDSLKSVESDIDEITEK